MTRQTRSRLAPGTAGIAAVALGACLLAGRASAVAAAEPTAAAPETIVLRAAHLFDSTARRSRMAASSSCAVTVSSQ